MIITLNTTKGGTIREVIVTYEGDYSEVADEHLEFANAQMEWLEDRYEYCDECNVFFKGKCRCHNDR